MAVGRVVVDASALVDLLVGSPLGAPVRQRLEGHQLHAPAHLDAEVLSALGRLHRAEKVSAVEVASRLRQLAVAPISRHELAALVEGAWKLRHNLRLVDALYVELATRLDAPLVTTNGALAAAFSAAELVTGA